MTENESKGKWCPFGRVPHGGGMALNNPDNPNYRVNCVGSKCMAWRTGTPTRFTALPGSRERPAHLPKNAVYVERVEIGEYVIPPYWEAPPESYCGLAGKP